MMKIIERTIESEGAPNNLNDLWLHPVGDNLTIKHYHNGKWRSVLGGGGSGSDTDAVKFIPQDLSDTQKEQVKENIGLGAVAYMGNIIGTI